MSSYAKFLTSCARLGPIRAALSDPGCFTLCHCALHLEKARAGLCFPSRTLFACNSQSGPPKSRKLGSANFFLLWKLSKRPAKSWGEQCKETIPCRVHAAGVSAVNPSFMCLLGRAMTFISCPVAPRPLSPLTSLTMCAAWEEDQPVLTGALVGFTCVSSACFSLAVLS